MLKNILGPILVIWTVTMITLSAMDLRLIKNVDSSVYWSFLATLLSSMGFTIQIKKEEKPTVNQPQVPPPETASTPPTPPPSPPSP